MKKYIAGIILLTTFASCDKVIDAKLTATANELNKTCPIMVDKETRLDNLMALPGKILQYNYTLVNYARTDIDTVKLKGAIMPGMIQGMKTMPDLKYMRDNKVTMSYQYKDKNGAYLMRIVLKPETYQ